MLVSALKIKFRVIIALILRETRTTFGNSNLGYLWALITPALGVAIFVLIFELAARQPPFGQSLALFFATGLLSYEYYNKLATGLMSVLDANKALLVYPIVTPTEVIFARFLLISITYLLVMFIFYSFLIFFGLANLPAYPFELIHAFVSIGLVGFAIGAFNSTMSSISQSWRHIYKIITRPLFLLSGIFFIPSLLPEKALNYLKWNPVLHLVEWVRVGYYPNYDSRILDKSFVISFALVFIVLGFFGERYYRNKRN